MKPHPTRRRKPLIAVRQAFSEFLRLPIILIAGFLILAGVSFWLDRSEPAWIAAVRSFLQGVMFADVEAVRDLLGAIAAGLITITSITISLLLIALQQSASALTHQVYDQFLRNWQNQFYFGFFVGLSMFALMTLASVGPLNPVIGATIALTGTVLALSMLLVLFYTTVHQMRPGVIIDAIHDHALNARDTQLQLVDRTRRMPQLQANARVSVHADGHGFVTRIDLACIEGATSQAGDAVEAILAISVGDYVVHGQHLGEVVAQRVEDARAVAATIEEAIQREIKRDITLDPLDAVEELETIGWTSISTAQSDPDAGILTIFAMRDILARWSAPREATPHEPALPIVYTDNLMAKLLNAFESLAVVASESMQHQSYAEILATFTLLHPRLAGSAQHRIEDIVSRTLSGLGDQILTAELDHALLAWIATLQAAGRGDAAGVVAAAHAKLAKTVGRLGGRSTRAG